MTGPELQALRKALDLTQVAMANQMGISRRKYIDLEATEGPIEELYSLAAERAAMINAVLYKNPMGTTAELRRDALELARLITG